jgi:hypothetical protein
MPIRSSNVVFVIVVVVAIALASVVAVHGHGGATALGTYGAGTPAAAGLADTSTVASSTGSAATAADPAKQQPTLDQFTSRNPFIQATTAPGSGSTGTTGSSTTSIPATVAANVRVSSPTTIDLYTLRRVGDLLPPTAAVFKITAIGNDGVSFALVNGYTLNGAASAGTIAESTTPTPLLLTKGNATVAYTVEVTWIGSASTRTSGSVKTTTGTSATTHSTRTVSHSIRAVAITSAGGVPSATLAVDGATLAPQTVGETISTSWGQIKVVGVNGPARTITIVHADAQVTLRVGQTVSQ